MERAIYKGPDYFNGIPARDLTVQEFAELTEEQREDLRLSSLYEVVEDGPRNLTNAPTLTIGSDPPRGDTEKPVTTEGEGEQTAPVVPFLSARRGLDTKEV